MNKELIPLRELFKVPKDTVWHSIWTEMGRTGLGISHYSIWESLEWNAPHVWSSVRDFVYDSLKEQK